MNPLQATVNCCFRFVKALPTLQPVKQICSMPQNMPQIYRDGNEDLFRWMQGCIDYCRSCCTNYLGQLFHRSLTHPFHALEVAQ